MKMLTRVAVLLVFQMLNLPQMSTHSPIKGLLVGATGEPNWTGYGVTSSDNGRNYFTQVEATWTVHEPAADSIDSENPSQISTWVGLGGDTTNEPKSSVLWQAGTENWENEYRFWYEDYGCNNPCPEDGFPVPIHYPSISYGDRVKVVVKLDGTVIFNNLSSGKSATYHVSIDNNHVGLTAEWISELTCTDVLNGDCDPLKFNSPHFSNAWVYGSKRSTYFDNMNYERYDLMDFSSHTIARPTSPLRHGFNVSCC